MKKIFLVSGILATVGITAMLFLLGGSEPEKTDAKNFEESPDAPALASLQNSSPEKGKGFEVLSVNSGQSIKFKLFESGVAASPDRVQAEYGEIAADGTYSTPDGYPPMGLDTITTYNDTGVPVAQVHVQIEPQAGYPEVQSPPAQNADPEYYEDSTAAEEVSRPLDEVTCPTSTVAGITGFVAPIGVAIGYDDVEAPDPNGEESMMNPGVFVDGIILLVVSPEPVKKGIKRNVLPSLEGEKSKDPKIVIGVWKVHREVTISPVTSSTFPSVGGGTVTYYKIPVFKVQIRDYYKSVDGKLVYSHSEQCTKYGAKAWSFIPSTTARGVAMGTAMGYDLHGLKFDPTAACKPMN